MLHQFADIHTHTPGISGSILSIPISGVKRILVLNKTLPPDQQQYYSLQLHPWHLTSQNDIDQFIETAHLLYDDPHFVAIGECGLDSLCQTPLSLQHKAFIATLNIAKELHKPVIIHCVRLWSEMMRDVTQSLGRNFYIPLIIHGFRKGPVLAQQLLDAGFSLSFGKNSNAEVVRLVPNNRLYAESDA